MDTQDTKEFAQRFKKRLRQHGGTLEQAARAGGMNFKQSLFNKLAKGTLRAVEEHNIARSYGCDVTWRENEETFVRQMQPKIQNLQDLYRTLNAQEDALAKKKTPDTLKALLETYGRMMYLFGEIQGHYEAFYGPETAEKLESLQQEFPFLKDLNMEGATALTAMKICTLTL